MAGCKCDTHKELGDLHRRERALDALRNTDTEGGDGVVGILQIRSADAREDGVNTYHHGMDTRVDESKHPDRRRHVADTRPHAQHGACMVVRLERGAALALHDDDERVDHLVELGQIKHPAPPGKTLVPDTSQVVRLRVPIRVQLDVWILALPLVCHRVVVDGVAQATRSMDLAERIDGSNDGVGLRVVGDRMLERADHGPAGHSRVDGQA